MVRFISASRRIKPLEIKFWERDIGALFLEEEMRALQEFGKTLISHKGHVELEGYVKQIDDQHFVLMPSRYTPQEYAICSLPRGIRLPGEFLFVHVTGRIVCKSPRLVKRRETELVFDKPKEVLVDDWKVKAPRAIGIKADISPKEFTEILFRNVVDLDPIVQKIMAQELVSCPPFERLIGGLNTSLYDSTSQAKAYRFTHEIWRILPPDLAKPLVLNTPYGKIQVRYDYQLQPIDADRVLPSSTVNLMQNRSVQPTVSELSYFLQTSRRMPRSLDDPVCGLVDIPTIVNPETEFKTSRDRDSDFEPDAFKFFLTQHLFVPTLDQPLNEIMTHLSDRIINLRDRFDIPNRSVVARYQILDASYHGRPQSIARIALSQARSGFREKITMADVDRALEETFAPNLTYISDVWRDLFTKEGGKIPDLSPDERKVTAVIRRYSRTGREYARFEEIQTELKISPVILRRLLDELMYKKRILYESPLGCYRII